MSFFNNIEKVLYHSNKEEVVSLLEYIIFEDEKSKEKYIIFKFQNNVNQVLKQIKFKVSQYDEKGNLIETLVLEHKGFEINANDTFVPKAKMKANSDCSTIQVETLYALFERVEWEKDEFKAVTYTVDDFRKDFSLSKKITVEETVKSKKEKVKKEKPKKKTKNDKRSIVIKNVMKQNITVSPKVWTIIFSIILFAFVIGTSFLYKNDANQFYLDGFEYTLTNNGVVISDYDNTSSNVIIPKMVNDMKVVGIDDKAFENCTIKSVTFSDGIAIGDEAFKNCKKLTTINNPNFITSVGDYAFKNCKELTEIEFLTANYIGVGAFEGCNKIYKAELPLATLLENSFKGCSSLITLDCLGTVGQLSNIFGSEVPSCFTTLRIGKSHFEAGYFQNMSSIKNLEFKVSNPTFQYGSLLGIGIKGYEINESMEVLYGDVISYSNYSVLDFPDSVTDIVREIEELGVNATSVQEVKISSSTKLITADAMSKLINLNTLYYVPGVNFDKDAFANNTRLTTLKMSTDYNYYAGVGLNLPYVTNLVIEGSKNVNESMFYNNAFSFDQIQTVSISNTVSGVNYYALNQIYNIRELHIPNFSESTLEGMGVSRTLESLYVENYNNNIKLNDNYIYYYNNLSSINLPEGVEIIGNNFISSCSSLTELVLPSTIKEIGNDFIYDCSSLYNLSFNEGIQTIGNSLINSCPNISSIIIPNSVTSLGSYVVANSDKIDFLYVPEVKNISLPLIGPGVTIAELYVPYVGSSAKSPVTFSQFNDSYYNTYSISIQNGFTAVPYMFLGSTSLESFKCNGEITNISTGFFGDCYNLNKLEISGTFNNKLVDLFGVNIKSFRYLVLNTSQLKEDFFESCTFDILMIRKLDVVLKNQFSNLISCNVLFLTLNNNPNVLDYSTLQGKVYEFYTDRNVPNEVYENVTYVCGNRTQDSFYSDFIY